ncbi:AraC family transcriptional regulator [Mucilaginibacter sp. RS28]|uniref:AraC family transcriptional regulator n=1 Tax=Mucilaginibacter straminoryzae TaxID=2932774 RepID=A0A9X2BD27_9SPHI|nr:helix-turn-helix domain-containing protein [Mucilaginibacter straminoryzae]MCJ8209853.1 AraC family transcriptional regulator [Mucilaginibacter straminoryzae]
MKHYKSIISLHRENGFNLPENPLLSLHRCNQQCSIGDREFTTDFYMIGFKKLKSGVIKYGRTKYDHENGSMSFVKPRQVIEFKDLHFDEDGFLIFLHEDLLNGHFLHDEVKKYSFFDYEVNEALHLSPSEESTMWELYHQIEQEYHNNPDEYSKDIMLGHVATILKYAQRFYKRQFMNRATVTGNTVSKFNQVLNDYFSRGYLQTKGLPSVHAIADELNLSGRYLSDLLKQETGKTAIDLIHIALISEAKNMLTGSDYRVSEIAYNLGFENLPYFSRLFKREVGVSPNEFKKQLVN